MRRAGCFLLAVAMVAGFLAGAARPASARSDMAVIAAANGRSEAQMTRMLADRTARVGARQRVHYVEPRPVETAPTGGVAAAAPFPQSQTFLLHSRPGSSRVIHLDFDGHSISGTAWNDDPDLGLASTLLAAPYSQDGAASFSSAEHDTIQSVWQKVSEDYAVFDVDVTTQDPGQAAITRDGVGDDRYGTRALVTNTSFGCGCGGLAYFNVFNDLYAHHYFQPALIFNEPGYPAKALADITSHEVGHNLGLEHDGRVGPGGEEYYAGHGAWGPIMGSPYGRPITQWSRGDYPAASNLEDDIATIGSSGAPLLPDDVGDTAAGAASLVPGSPMTASGLITTDADVDVYRFNGGSGPATISVSPAPNGPNLDIRLELRNAAGTVLASSNPPSGYVSTDVASGLAASVSTTLPAVGSYFLFVSGVGTDSLSTGYSGYGSLGPYTLTATVPPPPQAVTIAASPASVLSGQPFSITATASLDVGSTPYFIQVIEDGAVRQSCGTGSSCTYTATSAATGTRTFSARVSSADGSNAQVTSGSTTVTVTSAPSVALVASSTSVFTGQPVTLTATANFDVGPTPHHIQVLEDGVVRQTCGSGSTCTHTTSFSTAGTRSFRARVSNTDGSSLQATSANVTVRVDVPPSPPAFSSAEPPSPAPLGAAYSHTFSATGHPAPTFKVTRGVLPPGLGLDAATGRLSGTPTEIGSFSFTVTAANGVSPDAADASTVEVAERSGYWMLEANGTVYSFGDARPFAHGATGAVDIEPTPTGAGYWVVHGNGVLSARGDAPHRGDRPPLSAGEAVASISATPDGGGYWLFTSRGRVFAYGTAPHLGDLAAVTLNGPVLDSTGTPSGRGYYMVASDGGIFAFGDAGFSGSMGGARLNAPVMSLAPDPDGAGYWLVASDGGVFAFDAPFVGSLGGLQLNRPISGMVASGGGYLMVGEDGGIFAFGPGTRFQGSLGDNPPSTPIVAVASL